MEQIAEILSRALRKETTMAHAEICPICKGEGKLQLGTLPSTTYTVNTKICHGCGGKGWVEVEDR